MRRIAVLLGPLFVVTLPAAAYAMDHWGRIFSTAPTPDQPLQALLGLLFVVALIFIMAWLITHYSPQTSGKCALFVAVGSIATMYVVLEYIVILVFTAIVLPAGAWFWLIFLGVYSFIVLGALLLWAAPCCLKPVSPGKAALIAFIIALLHVLYAWITM